MFSLFVYAIGQYIQIQIHGDDKTQRVQIPYLKVHGTSHLTCLL